MSFKFPDGELKWLVGLWMLAGAGAVVYALYSGTFAIAGLGVAVLSLALGICYQVRSCAWILLVMLCLQSLRIIVVDVVIAEKISRLLKVALNIWFIHLLFRWLHPAPDESN